MLETWAQRGYIGETAEKSVMRNASALGAVDVLTQTIQVIGEYGNE
jgi:hypothetical protein